MNAEPQGENKTIVKPIYPISIALIDDAILFRKMLAKYLMSAGFTIACEANNGRELFVQLEKLDLSPDICIIDVNMPEMNGYETTEKLSNQYPAIGIIGHSFLSDKERNKMLMAGAYDCVDKGEAPAVLINAIMELATAGHRRAIRKQPIKF